MIGIVQKKRKIIGKCGFKMLRLEPQLKKVLSAEANKEPFIIVTFDDNDITNENMSAITIKSYQNISTERYPNLIDQMNQRHLERFKEKYGKSISEITDEIKSMDVIDLHSLSKIVTNIDLDNCNVYTFYRNFVRKSSKGFNMSDSDRHVYMAIRNAGHIMTKINFKFRLDISESPVSNLLFLKFDKRALSEYKLQ